LHWHGLSADLAPQKAPAVTFQTDAPAGFIHIDVKIDVKYLPPFNRQRSYAYVAIDRATRFVYLEILPDRRAPTAAGFLARFQDSFPLEVHTILTDNGSDFTDRFAVDRKGKPHDKPLGDQPFDRICGGWPNLEVYLSGAGRSDRRISPLQVLSTLANAGGNGVVWRCFTWLHGL
jgi:hypothetical protein